jgi:hypothetical protein
VAKETPRGWKISKEKQSHKIDAVVALAMACYAAVGRRDYSHIDDEVIRTARVTLIGEGGVETVMIGATHNNNQPRLLPGTEPLIKRYEDPGVSWMKAHGGYTATRAQILGTSDYWRNFPR